MKDEDKNKSTLQLRLLEKVISFFNSKKEAIDNLSEVLDIGKSNLYRKINGQTALKAEEVVKIVRYYGLSLDELMGHKGKQYLFSRSEGISALTNEGQETLFSKLLARLKETPEAIIHFAGREIPTFYLMRSPHLMFFKEFIWERVKLDDKYNYLPIDFSLVNKEFKEKYEAIFNFYASYQTIELWDKMCFVTVIEQIRHYFQVGILSSDDALMLVKELVRLLHELEKMLDLGSKTYTTDKQDLIAYYSVIPSPNWFYYVKSDTVTYIQAVFDTPNSVVSTNSRICRDAEIRFDAQRKQAYLISNAGTVERIKLFKHYKMQVQQLEQEIKFHSFSV